MRCQKGPPEGTGELAELLRDSSGGEEAGREGGYIWGRDIHSLSMLLGRAPTTKDSLCPEDKVAHLLPSPLLALRSSALASMAELRVGLRIREMEEEINEAHSPPW